jgi:cytidyltransferase-like protein
MKIVYAYVVADLLHTGHVLALENAKKFAGEDGILIVGVLTDEATMEKKSKPTLSFSERRKLIDSLKCVDCVVAQNAYSPIENVKKIRPDLLMESDSHSEEDLKETRKIVESIGCKIQVMPYFPEQSSTRIKDSIKNNIVDPNNLNKELGENKWGD